MQTRRMLASRSARTFSVFSSDGFSLPKGQINLSSLLDCTSYIPQVMKQSEPWQERRIVREINRFQDKGKAKMVPEKLLLRTHPPISKKHYLPQMKLWPAEREKQRFSPNIKSQIQDIEHDRGVSLSNNRQSDLPRSHANLEHSRVDSEPTWNDRLGVKTREARKTPLARGGKSESELSFGSEGRRSTLKMIGLDRGSYLRRFVVMMGSLMAWTSQVDLLDDKKSEWFSF